MKNALLACCAMLALATAPAVAQQKTIKIGFISTFSGPPAAIGNDMRNSFELGLDHLGRKLGGIPVEVIYEDDQTKPDVGVQKTQKLRSTSWSATSGRTWRSPRSSRSSTPRPSR
jgi:branched-chain amino acid transport system substrate-binding protein